MNKILILGGSSDIGSELINHLIKTEKYLIHIHYNSNKPKIRNNNIKYIKINLQNLTNLKKKIDSDYDIIINLVGYVKKISFSKFKINDIFESIKINSIAMFIAIDLSLKNMIKKKYGRIINTSSVGVKFGGGNNNFAYSLSKHINEFIPNEIRSYSNLNIFYNVVRIGVTDTKIHNKNLKKNLKKRAELIPVGKLAKAKDIAKLLIFLIEDNNYITNQIINISGGE